MAAGPLAVRSRTVSPLSIMQLSSLSRRSLTTRSQFSFLRVPKQQQQSLQRQRQQRLPLQRTSFRSYADDSSSPSSSSSSSSSSSAPPPKPKKRFRFLRWSWRLTWLTGVGLTGVLAYSIFGWRHPVDQVVPDPSKKTLVVLGMLTLRFEGFSFSHARVMALTRIYNCFL